MRLAGSGAPGKYQLLDGHLRLFALKELGETEADCLVASDDESFTYNARVNHVNPIAEHKMIMKAVQNGVPPERIAAAARLNKALLYYHFGSKAGLYRTAIQHRLGTRHEPGRSIGVDADVTDAAAAGFPRRTFRNRSASAADLGTTASE